MIEKIAQKIFDYFIINQRYFAIQKGGVYKAKNQYINKKTIENILINKESFLVYQEDYNYIKWICFDFDINKELIENGKFQENKEKFYQELIIQIEMLVTFLDNKEIDYLLEFSGNRGFHVWILFDEKITRQDGFIIFQEILKQSKLNLNTKYFALDKYPKSMYSVQGTDKGTGVKLPLSFHQKSKKYSILFNSIKEFDMLKFNISEMDDTFLDYQYTIINEYSLQKKNILFNKLSITQKTIQEEKEKHSFLNSVATSFKNTELSNIILSLNNCQHLVTIFSKRTPSEKERRVIVGLLGQLKNNNKKIGKKLLKSYFMSREGANETIIDQRLIYADQFCPPTCDFFRDESGINCQCDGISQTPLEFLEEFDYLSKEIFDFTFDIFQNIKKSQIRYTKQNDEIALFHILNNLNRYEYSLMENDIDIFLNSLFNFEHTYKYIREEKNKNRTLYSISARDKIITTFGIKILNSTFYKNFSSRSFGYKFNPSFKDNDIFENWFHQWNGYINQLKSLIYADDFKYHYILKLDIKSYYDSINLQKLQVELNYEIEQNFENEIIDENEKNIFLNIISNLLEFSKKVTGDKEKGLPQGPAYARYLAEIYLTSLDKVIENIIELNNGYYYRYVDDIFIILPRKEDVDMIERKIIEHLDTKHLSINHNKTYKGDIYTFRETFGNYVDTTKYFIDYTDKHQSTETKTTIHKASSKLVRLLEDKDERNLTFFFTHFSHSKMVQQKREELEEDIILNSKGRGSFFSIFWKYYFDKYNINKIDFSIFDKLTHLKRETFLNSIINEIQNYYIENKTLKSLLDSYLNTNLTHNEQLLLLEIYMINRKLFNIQILDIIGDELTIYNDLMLSEFSKDIPTEVLDRINKILTQLDKKEQFNYLYNIILFSEFNDFNFLNRFSTLFLDIVHTLLQNNVKKNIKYLSVKSNVIKYIQLLYISMLCCNSTSFESRLFHIWQNLLYNIENNDFKNLKIKKLSRWKNKLKEIPLVETNINFLIPIIKEDKYPKFKGIYSDKSFIIANYFDSIIELIYLSHSKELNTKKLEDMKDFLIKEKNMQYLGWIEEKGNHYPTQEICIQNAIYNNMIILKKDNQLLIRILKDHKEEFDDYLKNKQSNPEKIFEYKTITYQYDASEFEQPNSKPFDNLFQVIMEIISTYTKLHKFSEKYFPEKKYINHFYREFSIHRELGFPLIPFDYYSNVFIKEGNSIIKNEENYFKKIIEQIQIQNSNNKKFFNNEKSKIFDNFKESFFPKKIFSYSQKLEYLQIFVSKLAKIPQTIFEMEKYLVETILELKPDMELSEFLDIYLSFNRSNQNAKYLLFEYVRELKDKTLDNFLNTIQYSLKDNIVLERLFQESEKKIIDKLGNLNQYKKFTLHYEVSDNGTEIFINHEEDFPYKLDDLEYIELSFNTNELHTLPAEESKLEYFKEHTFYIHKEYQEDKEKDKINKIKLITIPSMFMKVFNIIKDRKKAFEKVETAHLIKPFRTIDELKDGYNGNFNRAVDILMAHQKYSNPKQVDIEQHLYQWLSCFRDDERLESMLYVIANHQILSGNDVSKFISNIEEYKNQNEYLITTLKTAEDNNGTHRLITLETNYENLFRQVYTKEFPKKILDSKKEKIVFLSDIMISGSQTKKAFENYYLAETLNDETREKEDYFQIDEDKFEEFKVKLSSLTEIVFISTIYTSKAKKTIKEYFTSIGFDEGRVIFRGEEKDFNDCIFNGLIEENNKYEFISLIRNRDFIKNNFEISDYALKNAEFSQNDNIDDRNIIVRFNSMPKMRFFLFTLQPKYYDKPLFQYRKD